MGHSTIIRKRNDNINYLEGNSDKTDIQELIESLDNTVKNIELNITNETAKDFKEIVMGFNTNISVYIANLRFSKDKISNLQRVSIPQRSIKVKHIKENVLPDRKDMRNYIPKTRGRKKIKSPYDFCNKCYLFDDMSSNTDVKWIRCSLCLNWYHLVCVGLEGLIDLEML